EPTITDALYWLMAQTTGGWPSCEDSLDLNDDGVLDDFDACLILTIVCELQPPPEPIVTMEPLTCGPDPTPDRLGCRDLGCYDP
ncbi:MAG: hypothetical protein HY721_05200, partial [Planctomycetes bacterium]|nr:hypothetical protein [Planctomycetota bacterium]